MRDEQQYLTRHKFAEAQFERECLNEYAKTFSTVCFEAHVFTNWTRMPSIAEQLAIEGSETADFSVSRFLLKPGRSYDNALKTFQPYVEVREPDQEARTAAERILQQSLVKCPPPPIWNDRRGDIRELRHI